MRNESIFGKMLKKIESWPNRANPLCLFAQHERTLTGESPQTAQIVGRLQPKARVSAARRDLEEAGGKHLV